MAAVKPDRGSELQRERNVKGQDFQREIRLSWHLVPNLWRAKITDGRGATRPADDIVLTLYGNILAELKRTNKVAFWLNMLRPNQFKGLVDFDQVIPHNFGLVFVDFEAQNTAYAFRLITALKYMQEQQKAHITRLELEAGALPRLLLPRLEVPDENGELVPGYDLKEVPEKCRSL
ncbi:MAG: hypothetical protein ACYC0N_00350 [Carboxydocellales bacterium]